MKNIIDLTGKRIMVTGASRGIGRETALLANSLGAEVILIARDEKKLQSVLAEMSDTNKAFVCPIDLSDINCIEEEFEMCVNHYGKFDGLVHCAGIGESRPIRSHTYEFIDNIMKINFYAFAEITRVFAKKQNHNKESSIIAMSSVSSVAGQKSLGAYCASKAAVDSLIRAYAPELAPKGIRINSVVAGMIRTEMYTAMIENLGKEAVDDNVLSRQFLGIGETQDVANTIAFLLSDAARIITGTGVVVDAGFLSC